MTQPCCWCISGHLDLTAHEFSLHYVPLLEAALAARDTFVVGDARGADAQAQAWLARAGASFTVFHMLAAPRHHLGGGPLRGGFASDDERDTAMTAASAADIAWVRPGRESSGTARNLLRRPQTGPPQVRQAHPEDWRRYRSLRLTALAQAPDAFGSTLAQEALQDDAFWVRRVHNPRAVTLLAHLGLWDVGLAVVAPASAPHDAEGGLYSVWVSPLVRGRGVGGALVEAALEAARTQGYRRLRLEVGDDNVSAIALYARHGFVPSGQRGAMPPPRTHLREHERVRDL